MHVVLVGADFEENLGVGMIAAVAEQAGHSVDVVPFNLPGDAESVARDVLSRAPRVVGLSIQFQHRAHEFLSLARRLRDEGYDGHITCGGQWPSLADREVLGRDHGVDTVVLHEGEGSFVDLLSALERGDDFRGLAGIAYRTDDGLPVRGPCRRLADDLDTLPFAKRYRTHVRHVGVPFIPIMGSRGCWGACTYCSITSFYRDARAYGGGLTLRHRSPDHVAQEMAVLSHAVGGDAIFCFHDDNFLLPRPAQSIARVREIRAALDRYGVGRAAMIGKCRPDSMSPELARSLRECGVVRLYVGVENASPEGSQHLNRRTQTDSVRAALKACREAGIFVCYNLLLFEPDATLDNVRDNIAFIREMAGHPVNFCRAEPYYGTPLQKDLEARDALAGNYLGFNYRIEDDRTELLFRIAAAAFRQRNFDPEGVGNRYMGLGYTMKLIEFFYEDTDGRQRDLARRAEDLTRGIALESADFLEAALELAASVDLGDRDRVARETVLLGLQIAARDEHWHEKLDDLYWDMEEYAQRAQRPKRAVSMPRELSSVAQTLALSASLAVWAGGCNRSQSRVADPVPADMNTGSSAGIVSGQVGGQGTGVVARPDVPVIPVVDPVPPPPDPVPPPIVVRPVDPVPPPQDPVPPPRIRVVDPAPMPLPGTGTVRRRRVIRPGDPAPPPPPPPPPDLVPSPIHKLQAASDAPGAIHRRLVLVDQWRDSSARQSSRSDDLPLAAPPDVSLSGVRLNDAVRVSLSGVPLGVSLRWQANSNLVVADDGCSATWSPARGSDQVRVAVRSHGGVAIVALRAADVSS